ncbi:MAG TPA: type II toxin-antitoxin system PrlF family antitoxin [Gemmatimonadaceae bacterium]|nr:type II toxin-antitoxin system PrlF family antitoxin [Gemmatimonadaceae bacterium]
MSESTMTSKGQITIPKAVRETLHLRQGDRVHFEVRPDGTVVLRARNKPILRLAGILKGKGAFRKPLTIEEMNPGSDPDFDPGGLR